MFATIIEIFTMFLAIDAQALANDLSLYLAARDHGSGRPASPTNKLAGKGASNRELNVSSNL